MKLILSRKGVDSGSGGCDSPLLDDRFVSIPIPGPGIPYADVQIEPGFSVLGLMHQLGIGTLKNAWVGATKHAKLSVDDATAHFDPDLEPKGRTSEWRPMFGQVGTAQAHLEKQGVAQAALFLFFGRFRRATKEGGTASWIKGSAPFHALWGWLEVDTVINVNNGQAPPEWTRTHPHFMHAQLWAKTKNVVHVGRERLSFDASLPGAGVFSRFRPSLLLSAEKGKGLTDWDLPAAFYPTNASLSYHGAPTRWSTPSDGRVRLQVVSRGQEFVIDMTPEIRNWIEKLFHEETWSRAESMA